MSETNQSNNETLFAACVLNAALNGAVGDDDAYKDDYGYNRAH